MLFLKKVNETDILLARWRKKKRRNITDTTETQKIIRDYFEELYTNKLDNLKEMDTLLEIYTLIRLSHKEIEHLYKPIMSKAVSWISNQKYPKKEKPRAIWFSCWILWYFKK